LTAQHFRVLGCLEDLGRRSCAVSLDLVSAALRLDLAALLRIVTDLERAGLR
jgi:RIO-like serine/threonine protein kinase